MAEAANSPPTVPIGFVGLGRMGLPMARRLLQAGFGVEAADTSDAAREAFIRDGGKAHRRPADASRGAQILITMLPNGCIVRDVVLGSGDVAGGLAPGALVIDMSSSAPLETRALGAELAARGISLIDAPVSGGVKRAIDGTLAIMAGGIEADIERARPILMAMGRSIFPTGSLGSGHAMKALNNYVSASGLVAACEALVVGRKFGLSPDTVIDVLNASTGRNNSTETKMKQFVIAEAFSSGFSLDLMAKDIRTAADLAEQLGLDAPAIGEMAVLWEKALAALGKNVDHTEIFRYLKRIAG